MSAAATGPGEFRRALQDGVVDNPSAPSRQYALVEWEGHRLW